MPCKNTGSKTMGNFEWFVIGLISGVILAGILNQIILIW
jgi:hypothetical protein